MSNRDCPGEVCESAAYRHRGSAESVSDDTFCERAIRRRRDMPRRMETIWDGLKDRGLSDDELEKVMGGNVRRIYSETIG